MNRKWLAIGVVILIVLGAGAYLVSQQLTAVPDTPLPDDAIGAETETVVNAEGRVVPVQQARLAYLSGGQVTVVQVAEGDLVRKDEPLLQLDTTDEEIAVRQTVAAVDLAKANLAGAESSLALARLGLDVANLAVRDAEADLAIVQAAASAEQIALAEMNVALAEAGIEQASGSQALALEEASRADIAAAQAQVSYAQANYDNALKTYQPILQNEDSNEEVAERAALRLNEGQAALTAAQTELDRLLAGATTAERVAAVSAVSAATNQRDAARAQLDLLLAGARAEQITIAVANVTSAETAVTEAQGQVARAETTVAQAEAALREAQTGLAAAENELNNRTLFAPFDGTVAAVNIETGEMIQAGTPAIVLADFSKWQIETTDLTELDIVAVAIGLPVSVQVDAFPGISLMGEVSDIAAASADLLGEVTYVATVDLSDTASLPLRWGMTAFVDVFTSEQSNLTAHATDVSPIPQIEAEGQVMPQSFVNLAFDTAGRVATISVGEDDDVAAGSVLIELDADALQLALGQANARVTAAEAGVMAARNQLTLAETTVAKAESAVTIAQANLALTRASVRSEEIEAAEAALAAAESSVTQAQAGRDMALDTITDADIARAEANLATATANLRAIEDDHQQILDACFDTLDGRTICPLYGPVEEQTRGQLEAAQANQTAAQAFLDVLNAGPTQAQRTAASGGVALAIANRDVAQAKLDLLLAGASPEQIEKAEVAVSQAELGVILAEAGVMLAETSVAKSEAELTAAKVGPDAIQAALDRLTLRATMAGAVISINTNPGELIAPGSPVVTLADLSGWLVETTDVSELDVSHVAVGDHVTVRFDAIADRTVAGKVTKIAEMPGMVQRDVVYQVTVQLNDDAADLPLRWGMTAVVAFD